MTTYITFRIGSSSPIPLLFLPPFGSRTVTVHNICGGTQPISQMACTSLTNVRHVSHAPALPSSSSSSSHSTPCSHPLMFSARMTVIPLARPFRKSHTTSLTSTPPVHPSSTSLGSALTGMGSPDEGTRSYNSTLSVVWLTMVSWQGLGGRSFAVGHQPLTYFLASASSTPSRWPAILAPTAAADTAFHFSGGA